jgi:hypothetical protein
MITEEYMRNVFLGKAFCPKYSEVKMLPCPRPPTVDVLLKKFHKICRDKNLVLAGVDESHMPDKRWLLDFIATLTPQGFSRRTIFSSAFAISLRFLFFGFGSREEFMYCLWKYFYVREIISIDKFILVFKEQYFKSIRFRSFIIDDGYKHRRILFLIDFKSKSSFRLETDSEINFISTALFLVCHFAAEPTPLIRAPSACNPIPASTLLWPPMI